MGIADTFKQRSSRAFGRGDFEEARRLAQKAQDQFTELATDAELPEKQRKKAIEGFKRTQDQIENAFQAEQDAQKKIS